MRRFSYSAAASSATGSAAASGAGGGEDPAAILFKRQRYVSLPLRLDGAMRSGIHTLYMHSRDNFVDYRDGRRGIRIKPLEYFGGYCSHGEGGGSLGCSLALRKQIFTLEKLRLLQAYLGTEEVLVGEFILLYTPPGAVRQELHTDILTEPNEVVSEISAFQAEPAILVEGRSVYTYDVPRTMLHVGCFGIDYVTEEEISRLPPAVRATTHNQTALFDSTLLHYGSANTTEIPTVRFAMMYLKPEAVTKELLEYLYESIGTDTWTGITYNTIRQGSLADYNHERAQFLAHKATLRALHSRPKKSSGHAAEGGVPDGMKTTRAEQKAREAEQTKAKHDAERDDRFERRRGEQDDDGPF